MTQCADCDAMVKAPSSRPPGPMFELIGSEHVRGDGFRKSSVEKWRCGACNTRWVRDMDSADPHARWEPDL
jgi:hypothetical protein